MKVDAALTCDYTDPARTASFVAAAAGAGFDRLCSAETDRDPFLPIALGAGAAREHGVELATNIAVAFARSPMTLAHTAHDLQTLSGGRLILGLGTQVKAHVTRRFSMPWSRPAARMREYITALRATWTAWEQRTPLRFEGEFYTHILSAPMFEPPPSGHGAPPVLVAAVGPAMAEVAGEVGDGVLCHAFTSPGYLAEVTLPAVRRGRSRSGGSEDGFQVGMPVLLATGPSGHDLAEPIERVRRQLAFYGSTPAYRAVLDHHGWGDLHVDLHRLSREQRWDEMSDLVEDEVVHELAVVADADRLADELAARYAGLVTHLRLNLPWAQDPETWLPVIAAVKEGA